MGWNWRFWRRMRVAPGVSLNWSKSGPSISVGPRGAKVTLGRKGIRRTVGIPGTGLFATNQESWDSLRPEDPDPPNPASHSTPTPALAPEAQTAANPAKVDVEPCGFCGGQIGTDGRCEMCGQPADRWMDP